MARPLKLKPTKDPASGQWRVNVIAKLSPSGCRERRFFPTQTAALGFIEELKARRDNLATADGGLTTAQVLDAISALEILTEYSITLTEAAHTAVKVVRSRIQPILFKDLFNQFVLLHKNDSGPQRRDINWAKSRFTHLDEHFAHQITRNDILSPLAELAESSRINILKTIRNLYNYAKDLDFVEKSPLRPGDFKETKKARDEIYLLPVPKIRSLLEAALTHDIAVLPTLVAETFSGIRPEEVKRIVGTDIDLSQEHIIVRASVSKTVSARKIKLEACGLAWWKICQRAGLLSKAQIAPFSETKLRDKLRKIRYMAGYRGAGAKWTPGALRDAFASYHLAQFGSIDRLVQEMGHTDYRTTRDHYLGLASTQAAGEFWNLFPPGKGKIIKFPKSKAA